VAWGDYDQDGRLDFLITGRDESNNRFTQLWRNNLPGSNAPPVAPTGLAATVSGNTVTLNWTAPADDLTPAAGLNYNVRIGTTPGGANIVSSHALADGTRLVPQMGNAGPNLSAFYDLPAGFTYYWSVQAVDTSFGASPFAAEQQFTIGLRIVNLVRFPSGVIQFSLTNQSSETWEIRAATNLSLPIGQWDLLGLPISVGGGLYQFNDDLAPDHPQRFYLLRKQ
jgi:hypothetical protein